MPALRASARLLMLFLTGLPGVAIQQLILFFSRGRAAFVMPKIWHRFVCRLLNIKVIVEGEPVRGRQVIYIANHLSYLDIPVFTSVIPSSFVSRSDVRDWPIAGLLGRLQQTVFISRDRKDILKAKDSIAQAVASGRNLIIFAEGTSSDGSRVLPFKSGLFSLAIEAAAERDLLVQPVTIALAEVDGRPADAAAVRDLYAWHGDMTLPPHLWHFLKLKGARIRLHFHPARAAAKYSDRKALCADCYTDVTRGLEAVPQAA
jgi:1-acyl-sn-glycerol-3-phosphate acyltransferase